MRVTIPSKSIAESIESDLEGRLEVMADDSLRGKPDYQDADAVAQIMREQTAFPATIELSDAEAQQLGLTVENALDYDDVTGLDELHAALKAQGYPR